MNPSVGVPLKVFGVEGGELIAVLVLGVEANDRDESFEDAPASDDHIEESDDTPEADSVDGDGGTVLSSTLSRSPSIGALSSSVDGKKLRNSSSACHLDALRNSTQTSIRPGRDNAGSRRSR